MVGVSLADAVADQVGVHLGAPDGADGVGVVLLKQDYAQFLVTDLGAEVLNQG